MKKVYLIRHGQTGHNVKNYVQDHSPLLTPEGEQQARVIADRVAGLDFNHLIVSDYERTKQTAKPIIEKVEIGPVFSELFREIRRPSEFFHTDRSADAYQQYLADELANFSVDENWRHSDEENFIDTSNRITQALQFVAELDGDVVVISHGHFIIKMIATVAAGGQMSGAVWQQMRHSFQVSNTGVSTLLYDEVENKWRILTFNDIAHFAE